MTGSKKIMLGIDRKSLSKNLKLKYLNIIPCGISDKGITNLKKINDQNYDKLSDIIIKNLSMNLEI